MVCRPGIHEATTSGVWIPALDHKLRSNHKKNVSWTESDLDHGEFLNLGLDRARADTFLVISSSESRKRFSEIWKKKSVGLE